ncbi:MAG: DUF6785 family protein [Thermofilaceae archaeon]
MTQETEVKLVAAPPEIRPKGLTWRVILVALIVATLYFLPLMRWRLSGPYYLALVRGLRVLNFFGMQFFFLLFLLVFVNLIPHLINKLLKRQLLRPFTPQESAVLFAMVWGGIIPLSFSMGLATYSYLFGTLRADYKSAWPAVPSVWVPKYLDESVLWDGGAPFTAFIPTIILFTFAWYMMYFFGYGLAILFKEQFLEIERLEYPLARLPSWVISQATTVREGKVIPELWRNKLFWIAFLIGMILHYEGPPGIDLVPGITWPTMSYDISYVGQLPPPFTNVLIAWSIDLTGLSYYLLFPLDVLLTSIVAYAVFWLLWPIAAVAAGLRAPMTGATEWPIFYVMGRETPPIMPSIALDQSVWIGIALLVLWEARHHLASTLKAARTRMASEKVPFSYRTAWLMLGGAAIALIALMISGGGHPVLAVYSIIVLFMAMLAQLRIRGDIWPGYMAGNWGPWTGGGDVTAGLYDHIAVAVGAAPGFYVKLTPEQAQQFFATRSFVEAMNKWYAQWNPAISAIEAMKVCDDHKTSLREGLIGQMIVAFYAIPLVLAMLTLSICWNGVKTYVNDYWSGHQLVWPAHDTTGYLMREGPRPWGGDMAPWFYLNTLLGIALVLLIGIARARLPWFPLNPVGLAVFSVSFYAFMYGLLAYLIKLAVLKILGAEFYERKFYPIIVGLFLGTYTSFIPGRAIVWAIVGK